MEKRCKTEHCLGTPVKGRNFCHKCRSRKYRLKNPCKDAYYKLKGNANRRGIKFELSYEYWKQWCEETGYLETRGTSGESMTVDRVKAYKGYVDGNLQILTRVENVEKYRKVDMREIDPEKDVDSWWKNL